MDQLAPGVLSTDESLQRDLQQARSNRLDGSAGRTAAEVIFDMRRIIDTAKQKR